MRDGESQHTLEKNPQQPPLPLRCSFLLAFLWIRPHSYRFSQHAITHSQGHGLPAEVLRFELSQTQPGFNVLKYTLSAHFRNYGLD